MKTINSVEELKEIERSQIDGFIFRGQNIHYVDKSNEVSISTSFHRNGCIPPLMQKWDFYCREVLLAHKGPDWKGEISLSECQAALQHYGWRSFYLDFTNRLKVAAWFASHRYVENREMAVVEDWTETGLMCVHRSVMYNSHDGFGYLYIVDRNLLNNNGIGTTELERFRFSDFVSRFDRQDAVMVGPVDEKLPSIMIVEILKVPVHVLLEYAGDLTQEYLFPSRNEDRIYKLLLAVPFILIKNIDSPLGSFGPYIREIDIPEYDYKFKKRPSANVVFYKPGYQLAPTSSALRGAKIVQAPESFLYHVNIELDNSISAIEYFMGQSQKIFIETDGLLKLPVNVEDGKCLKGAVIEKVSDGIICISGLVTNQNGLVCGQIGLDQGWHYAIKSGKYYRLASELDCPCNNHRKHTLEMTIVRKLEEAIFKKHISFQ